MKRKTNGFTLPETLLTMAIVGIVAAVTIPSLAKLNQQDGAVLGRAIEQIELGCQNIIQDYNAEQEDASFTETLLGTTSTSNDYSFSEELLANEIRALNTKDNEYTFDKVTGEYSISNYKPNAEDKLDSDIMDITIDTNGFDTKPNVKGKDRFNFTLKNSGKLIPADDETKEMVQRKFQSGLIK